MKTLKYCLKQSLNEEISGAATPLNTTGMGNCMPPTDNVPGSEPMCVVSPSAKSKTQKRRKSKKDQPNHDI